ncbi:MAG TPA: response regulator transcription factor [Streptosporangiaceae bacterium]|nr:response regulator transcription factor [Streptosporangiaceae bacterium]
MAGHPAEAGPAAHRPVPGRPSPDDARPPASVLLAEHEPEVAEMSARFLRRDGLRVRLAASPERALAELAGGPDAVAVIDLTMPGLDARRIRRALRIPVIFLVADLKAPRPRGLAGRRDATGARRWLARPFSPRQLVAMVREALAQTGPARAVQGAGEQAARTGRAPVTPADRSAGELRLDGSSRTVIADGHHVSLTVTEYALLAFMMDNPGLVLSRQRLLAAVGRQGAGDRAADVHIAQLRAKIRADPRTGRIRTVRGAGYALDP